MNDGCFRVQRILTMDPQQPEIHDGQIVVRSGRIDYIGPWGHGRDFGVVHDLGSVTLAPGLINAHAHLGLSHLAGRIPPNMGFSAWADALFAHLREPPGESALRRAVAQMRDLGTCFVADVVGSGGAGIRKALDARGVGGHLFRECAGRMRGTAFEPRDLPGAWSPAVHALYSTDEFLARSIKAWCTARDLAFSLHLAEVPGENEMFLTGGGPFADFLRTRRLLPKAFVPPGKTVVAHAHALGLLDTRTLAVHCVQAEPSDIALLARSGATVCLCLRSNAWIGVGAAPVGAFFEAGVPLCVGTDSLASNADLDLWSELRAVRALLPRPVPFLKLLSMATSNPARVLGIDAEYGLLAAGRRADWTIVPADLCEDD